ncbi:hypothetical protein D3C74_399290 [compost metagenome]
MTQRDSAWTEVRLGRTSSMTPANPMIMPRTARLVAFCRSTIICISRIISGPVADNTAAIPEVTYCSAQYRKLNVPKVSKPPVTSISLRSSKAKSAFFLQTIHRNRIAPAARKRIPAEKNGGAAWSTPIFIAKKVVPNMRHTIK